MFKLALNAGHWRGTAKGIPAQLSPTGSHVDEWSLNDRICSKVEKLLAAYEGCEPLRIDDPTGEKDLSLSGRTDTANAWGADFYLAIHHNAGVNGGSGGGIVAFVHPAAGKETCAWQEELYAALIDATGLKGNRSQPLAKSNLHECRETAMPAVLLELGFMDSTADIPVILSEEYADACAGAIVQVIARRAGLPKKPAETPGKLFRVQAGAFRSQKNAEAYAAQLQAAGFNAFVVEVEA